MPSWIIALILLILVVAGAVYSIIKDMRSGKCSCGHKCGGSCSGCKYSKAYAEYMKKKAARENHG
ncbi:MAG: hypothetical protein J6F31_02160 [Oscillospiraceae bacterium]|nr:hypothetical protein [Oscillospiraceae bacterium]